MRFIRLGIFVTLACLVAISPPALYGQAQGKWQTELVDKGRGKDAGLFSSLVVDRIGNLHLVYSTANGNVLRYAFRAKAEKRWDKTIVDSTGGSFASLAVDERGWAHIAYNSPKLTGLHYAEWDGKKWHTTLIDPIKTNYSTSIQLDAQGYPHISYYREQYSDRQTAKSLKYAYFDGKSWYLQTVDHRNGTGNWNSLALDGQAQPNISYSISTGFLGFAYLEHSASAWEHGLVDVKDPKAKKPIDKHEEGENRHMDGDNSLAIDSKGQPRVAYINLTTKTITYAWREGTAWTEENIDSVVATGGQSDRISLKLDRNGDPHIAYYDSGIGMLKYATRIKKEWHTEVVDDGSAGQYASLCLDENDQPFVSYYSAVNGELRIAHRQSSNQSLHQTLNQTSNPAQGQ
jgi:hypothetical protein